MHGSAIGQLSLLRISLFMQAKRLKMALHEVWLLTMLIYVGYYRMSCQVSIYLAYNFLMPIIYVSNVEKTSVQTYCYS